MPNSKQLPEAIASCIVAAESRIIGGFVNAPPNRLIQLLLRKANEGLVLNLLVPDNHKSEQTIFTDRFIQRCLKDKIQLRIIPANQLGQSFILLDDETLLLEWLTYRGQPRVWGIGSLQQRDKFYKKINHLTQSAIELFDNGLQEEGGITNSQNFAPQIMLSLKPTVAKAGEPFVIEWDVRGANAVYIKPNIGPVNLKGSKLLRCFETTEFTINAKGRGGVSQLSRRMEVLESPQLYFKVYALEPDTGKEIFLKPNGKSPHRIGVLEGQLLRIYWRAYFATRVVIGQENFEANEGVYDFVAKENGLLKLAALGEKEAHRFAIYLDIFSTSSVDKMIADKKSDIVNVQPPELLNLEASFEQLNEVIQKQSNDHSVKSLWDRFNHFIKPNSEEK